MTVRSKPVKRLKRRRRVRAKVHGSAERPRISVFRSNRGIFAQLVDDDAGRTLASVNWTESDLRSLKPMEQANKAGALLAERAKAAGVETVVAGNIGTLSARLLADTAQGGEGNRRADSTLRRVADGRRAAGGAPARPVARGSA